MLWAILFTLIAGYAWAKVTTDFDPDADFSKDAYFSWIDREKMEETQLPDHLRIRLRRVTEEVLATKGYQPAPAPPQTDFLLIYYVGVRDELQVNHYPYSMYRPWGYGYWGGYGYGYTEVRKYHQGTVVLDIVDARSHQLVWTGTLEKAVNNPNPPGKKIEKSVKKLLKNFPPQK